MDASTIRTLSPTTHRQEIYIFGNEKKYLNFSSNDYLNIGTNEHLRNSFLEQILKKQNPFTKNLYREALFSSSSSRLLSGNTAPYTRLETFLAKWFEKESALLFNSGYHANLGIITGLMQKGDCIFSDKLNHTAYLPAYAKAMRIIFATSIWTAVTLRTCSKSTVLPIKTH